MAVLKKKGTAEQGGRVNGAKHKRKEHDNGLKVLTPLPLLSEAKEQAPFPLDYTTAIAFLRGEALQLPPEAPRGLLNVGFMGQPLGMVKNIGTRANNLYPKEWRIRSTHTPPMQVLLSHSNQ